MKTSRSSPTGAARKLWLAVALVVLAAACGGDSPTRSRSQPDGSPAPEAEPVVCPLTGEVQEDRPDLSHPALAIKVENSQPARPQAGLEDADIVYEEIVEGGITRFMAIYHCSESERVGPVRSARMVDPDILVEYAPVLFGYAGANSQVLEKVRSTRGVVDLPDSKEPKAYSRDKSRRSPHNLFTTTKALRDLSDEKGAPETGLVFADPEAESTPSPGPTGSPAAAPAPPPGAEVSFSFSGAERRRYVYEESSGKYLRFHGTSAHNSVGSGQLKATNVVVMKVRVTQGTIRDAAGNFSPEIQVTGGGEAIVVSKGRSAAGRWTRGSLSEKTKLVDEAGEPLTLAPGNTWIHLLPEGQQVDVK